MLSIGHRPALRQFHQFIVHFDGAATAKGWRLEEVRRGGGRGARARPPARSMLQPPARSAASWAVHGQGRAGRLFACCSGRPVTGTLWPGGDGGERLHGPRGSRDSAGAPDRRTAASSVGSMVAGERERAVSQCVVSPCCQVRRPGSERHFGGHRCGPGSKALLVLEGSPGGLSARSSQTGVFSALGLARARLLAMYAVQQGAADTMCSALCGPVASRAWAERMAPAYMATSLPVSGTTLCLAL